MEELPKRGFWLPSPGHLVAIAVILIAAALAIPGLRNTQRSSNERNASTSLKMLTSAEADFRANDRDWNHVNDFWTGDVSDLYYIKPPQTRVELKLIDVEIANADPLSLFYPGNAAQRRYAYWFQALERDDNYKGQESEYKKDTDKSGRRVHHETKFGFCAFTRPGWEGNYIFFINENNTIFREEGKGPRDAFPSDAHLKSYWSVID